MFQKAKSVWAEDTTVNQYLNFHQLFETEKDGSLRLHIRCHSNYVVWVNGRMIGFGQYPDYEEYKVADCLEIPAAVLRRGGNILAVLAYCQFEDSSTYRKETPSLIFELKEGNRVLAASGEDTLVREEYSYRSGKREMITGQLGFTFCYDSRKQDDWQKSLSPSGFRKARVLSVPGPYYPRPIKKLELKERCPAILIAAGNFLCKNREQTAAQRIYHSFLQAQPFRATELGEKNISLSAEDADGVYVIVDLQKERAGCLELDIEVEEDCLIDIGYGEHLDDLRVRSFVGGRHYGCSYYAVKGSNHFIHYLTRLAGRYLQLHFYTSRVMIRYVGLRETPYPLRTAQQPEGLDALEYQIYATGVETLRLCMHEHYEDCPWREQALYAMDSRTQMLAGYGAFREYAFPKASLRLLGLGIRSDGLLELCAPARVPVVIPVFSLMWVISLQEYVTQSGDTAFGKKWLPTARIIMETFCQHMKNGLVSLFSGEGYWNFYEWSDGLDGTAALSGKETDCLVNLFYAYAIQRYQILSEILGIYEERQQIQNRYDLLKQKINRTFWDEKQKGYRVSDEDSRCPELVQALAVISGIGSPHRSKLIAGLANRSFSPHATLSSKIFTYEALLTEPSVYPLIRSEIKDIWGKMLFAGATSFWETEKGADDFDNAGSLCHGWSAVPVYVYWQLLNNE